MTDEAKESYPNRVAKAAGEIKLASVFLSALAAPFYVLGWLVGVLIAVFVWCLAAVKVGIEDARGSR
jgi:hypothetical protein